MGTVLSLFEKPTVMLKKKKEYVDDNNLYPAK